MARYIVVRLIQGLVAVLVSTVIIFILARMTGDPRDFFLPPQAGPETWAVWGEKLGLDRPLYVQYVIYMNRLLHGDLGMSYYFSGPALPVVISKLGATTQLGLAASIVALLLAVPIGVMSAVWKDKPFDVAGKLFALLGQSLPSFWLGTLLIFVFSAILGILPASGKAGIVSFILPGITLGWYVSAGILRLLRSSMLDVLGSEYVTMARIKGVKERSVIWKHCLRNAALPAVTFTGVMLGAYLIIGSVTVEVVFAWPGIGRLAYDAVLHHDYPIIQGVTLVITVLFVLINLLVDIFYVYLDPKIRYS